MPFVCVYAVLAEYELNNTLHPQKLPVAAEAATAAEAGAAAAAAALRGSSSNSNNRGHSRAAHGNSFSIWHANQACTHIRQ